MYIIYDYDYIMISSTEKTSNSKVISAGCDCECIRDGGDYTCHLCTHLTMTLVTTQGQAKANGKGKARSAAPALANTVKAAASYNERPVWSYPGHTH